VTVVRDAGWPEVYDAFNDEADAKNFPLPCRLNRLRPIQGGLVSAHSRWTSRRFGSYRPRCRRQCNQNDHHPMRNAYWIALYADPGPPSGATTRSDRESM
jgi:hypothetical protein